MQQRTIREMVTLFTVFSMIPSKVVITVRENPTFIDWQKFLGLLLTSAWRREFLSHVNMVDCWITVLSVEFLYQEPFMLKDKPASNYCLEHIQQ